MMTMSVQNHVLVAGASGVIGSAAVEAFARAGWKVTALSRRRPFVDLDCAFTHASVDLDDADACAGLVAASPPVTHLVYAAVAEAPGLVSGWRDAELIARNGCMFANLLDPLAGAGSLRHVSVLQGTKAYGAHYHEIEVPAREDTPRDDHPNFYWLHEDHARLRGAETGFGWTIFRPQVLFGHAPGAAMNPVAPIGAYAALCREMGLPFGYPGRPDAYLEAVDTGLLAEAFVWAADSDAAKDQIFNLTNGDVFVPRFAWARLASSLGFAPAEPEDVSLVAFFAREDVVAAWDRLVQRHGLQVASLPALVGESHHYTDLLIGNRLAEKTLPTVLSTIKIRQAGFAGCRDSVQSLLHWLDRMVGLKLLPPLSAH